MFDEGATDSGTAIRREDEVAGVGDVGGTAYEIGLDVVRTHEIAAETRHTDGRRMRDPIVVELCPCQRCRLREPLAGGDDATECVEQLVMLDGGRSGDLHGHATKVAARQRRSTDLRQQTTWASIVNQRCRRLSH